MRPRTRRPAVNRIFFNERLREFAYLEVTFTEIEKKDHEIKTRIFQGNYITYIQFYRFYKNTKNKLTSTCGKDRTD